MPEACLQAPGFCLNQKNSSAARIPTRFLVPTEGFGSNWDLDVPIWLQPKSIWTDLDPFGLAQKPNVFGNQFVQIRACPNLVVTAAKGGEENLTNMFPTFHQHLPCRVSTINNNICPEPKSTNSRRLSWLSTVELFSCSSVEGFESRLLRIGVEHSAAHPALPSQ